MRERDADRGRPGLAVLSWAVPVQVPVSDTDADGEVGKAPSPPHWAAERQRPTNARTRIRGLQVVEKNGSSGRTRTYNPPVNKVNVGHLACNDVTNLTAGARSPAQVRFDDHGVAGPLHCHPALTRRAPACCSSWFQ